jgi:hypothetical protein
MDIYKLYRNFWDYSFEHPQSIRPTHVAIYSFAVEHCNRLGWKHYFGFPTSMAMEATGVKSYSVFKKHFDDLVSFGFFEVAEYSKNQYSSNVIALKENCKANVKALDKALSKHASKQVQSTSESTGESIVSIDIQEYKETILQKDKEDVQRKRFTPPTLDEVREIMKDELESQKFMAYYETVDWMVSKKKMKNWKSAVAGWMLRKPEFSKGNQPQDQQPVKAPIRQSSVQFDTNGKRIYQE